VRIAVLSDVHGNLAALQAVALGLRQESPLDAVIVAGDHLLGGPRPAEVWRFLGEAGWTLVRGNEDESLAGRLPTPQPAGFRFARAYAEHHRWAREQLEPRDLAEIGALPFEVRLPTPAGDLLVVHASPRSTTDRFGGPHNTHDEVAAAYEGTGAGAIAFGHWHASFVRPTPFSLLVNVASVGLPLDRQPLAAYTLLTARATGWTIEQRRVPYDWREEERAAAERGLPPWRPDDTVERGLPRRGCQAA
jgi:predicted phosphodiesterase